MIRLNGLFPVVAVVSAFWLLPVEVSRAVHFPGHGLDTQPSGQQIDELCRQYPALIGSPNTTPKDRQKYKKLYRQHCAQPAARPNKPATPELELEPAPTPQTRLGRIERIQPPACLGRDKEIHVRGENLRDGGLNCRLEAGGRPRSLQAYSRTAREFRFRLDDLQPGPDYVLQCEVDGDRQRISLKGCDGPGAPAGTADVDLAAEIRAGTLRPGETQLVEVLIPNRGRSRAPRNERYRVMLALVDRDLTRAVGMKMGGRETLVEKSQWLTRVPAAGQSERVSIAINVPGRVSDTGSLHWCAFADHEGQIGELNERNNLACTPASGGGTQAVARDDLSKLFGSAVRNQDLGARIPEEQRVAGEGDSSAVPRTMMYEGDGGQPGIAAAEAQVDLAEQPPVPDAPDFLAGRPDLAVTGFRLASWGSCDPDEYTMFTFEVTVENQGTAPAAAPQINVADIHEGHHWGNGTVLGDTPLWPGESRTGSILVGSIGEPSAHMMDAAPHPFMAMVNAGNAAGEPDVLNNYYATLINVDPRPLCGSIIAGEAPEGIHETATMGDLGLDAAALEARVAELPAVQRDNGTLPGVEAGSVGDRGLGARADAIEDAHAARGLEDLTEVMRDGLAVPGFEGGEQDPLNPGGFDIANRDTGNPLDNFHTRPGQEDTDGPFGANPYMPEPTAPRNQEGDTPNAGTGANPFIPSMNPRDWASGASSNHVAPALGSKLPGRVEIVRTSDYTERTHTWQDSDGWHQIVDTFRNDDTSSQNVTHVTEAGTTNTHTEYDENGNVTERLATLPEEVPESSQDPNSPGYSHEFARWHSQFDHSKKKGAPIINRVNPGPEGATPDPRGPRLILPESQLTGNPSPEAARNMDAASARQTREQLIEKIRGPGGHPGDESGDAIQLP